MIKMKGLTMPSAGEDVKEVKLIVGVQIGTTILKNCLVISTKAEHTCNLWPRNSISRYKSIEMHTYVHQKTHTKMFIEALFVSLKLENSQTIIKEGKDKL